ncbi:MAG: nucleotidyltransferase family protein [Telmatospirillum sp.]|nr:nucleotidyltransferase family protein [Telmatospirillum sp.]
MRALLLAAGLGTRLRPLTDRIPKCLVPIRGKPLLDYWLDALLTCSEIDRIMINTGYLAEEVRRHVESSRWCDRIDLAHEPRLLGTGGTVHANRAWLTGGPFLVAHADNLSRFDLASFIARHRNRPAAAAITMMTFDTDTPQSCGIVEEDGNGLVIAFHEKKANPPGRRANGAVYIFEPVVSAFLADLKKPVIDLSTEVIPAFLGRICTFHNDVYHRDIGTPESLTRAEHDYSTLSVPRARSF